MKVRNFNYTSSFTFLSSKRETERKRGEKERGRERSDDPRDKGEIVFFPLSLNRGWCNTLTSRKWNPSTHWSTAGVRGRGTGHKLWSPTLRSSPPPTLPIGGFRYSLNFHFRGNRTPPVRSPFVNFLPNFSLLDPPLIKRIFLCPRFFQFSLIFILFYFILSLFFSSVSFFSSIYGQIMFRYYI